MSDTAYLQELLDSDSRIPPGSWSIDAPLTIDRSNVSIDADGAILTYSGSGSALVLGNGSTMRGAIRIAGLTLKGGGIQALYCYDSFLQRCRVIGGSFGVEVFRGYQFHVESCNLREITSFGIRLHGQGNDQYVRDTLIVGQNGNNPALGVDIQETGAAWLDCVGTIAAGTGLVVQPVAGKVVEFLWSSRCAFDQSSSHGMLIGGGDGSVRSWESNSDWASSNGGNGILVQSAASVSFRGLRAFNNQLHGLQLSGSDFLVDGCTFSGNGGANPPNYHGLVLDSVSGARIVNCRSGQVAHFASLQGYGALVDWARCSRVILGGCDFSANQIGGIN